MSSVSVKFFNSCNPESSLDLVPRVTPGAVSKWVSV